MNTMGKVRIKIVKRLGKQLIDRYPDMFSRDFNHNKAMVQKLLDIKSKKLRNQIAGYVTHLVKIKSREQEEKESKTYPDEWSE